MDIREFMLLAGFKEGFDYCRNPITELETLIKSFLDTFLVDINPKDDKFYNSKRLGFSTKAIKEMNCIYNYIYLFSFAVSLYFKLKNLPVTADCETLKKFNTDIDKIINCLACKQINKAKMIRFFIDNKLYFVDLDGIDYMQIEGECKPFTVS